MITIHTHDARTLETGASPEQSLEQAVFLTGLWAGVPLCAGLGRCGLCRVRFLSEAPAPLADEHKKLSEAALKSGWRLACLHPALPCEIELPEPVRASRRAVRNVPHVERFSLAVDLGTTTMHWSALTDGRVIAHGGELNPQNGLGGEVMSRLAHSLKPGGATTLQRLVCERIRSLVRELEKASGGICEDLCISGNSVMTYLLLGLDGATLASAPYRLNYSGGDRRTIDKSIPKAYIPPLLAPFVGADLSAGLAFIEDPANGPEYPFLLADLGTNGEFVLALSPQRRLVASVPMGPAIEGVGLSCGRTAGPGAVTGFELTPLGMSPISLPGKAGHPGMTGTAYFSLAALLLAHGILDESGRFGHGTTPLAAKLSARVTSRHGEPVFDCDDGLYLSATDVEELLKVKAAFDLAVGTLLRKAGIGPSKLKRFHLAGALGEHASIGDLERLGFLPSGIRNRVVRAGNTSLQGAALLLNARQKREWIEQLPASVEPIDLTEQNNFTDEFVKRMRFTHVG